MEDRGTVVSTDSGLFLEQADTSLRVDFATPAIVRVRKFAGDSEPVSHLIRYGFFRANWPPVDVQVEEQSDAVVARSDTMAVAVERPGGRLAVRDAGGRKLLAERKPARVDPSGGFGVEFELTEERRLFGLGDQTRERVEHRGTKGDLWVRNVSSYVPVPLVLTNDGFGLLFNTTRRLHCDLGASAEDRFAFESDGGSLHFGVGAGSGGLGRDESRPYTGKPMIGASHLRWRIRCIYGLTAPRRGPPRVGAGTSWASSV